MNERIDIPEGEEKAIYSQRFREIAKGYKLTGWAFAVADIILTVIITISYASGKSSRPPPPPRACARLSLPTHRYHI